jgi:hypothetical protein
MLILCNLTQLGNKSQVIYGVFDDINVIDIGVNYKSIYLRVEQCVRKLTICRGYG